MTFQPWLRNCHAQTLLGCLIRHWQSPLRGHSVEIATRHGDTLPGWWSEPLTPHRGLTLMVIHGIGGNHQAGQLVALAHRWLGRSLGPVLLFSLRGAFRPPSVPRLYHGGSSDDVEDVYDWAAARSQNVLVAGFSLGANLLVKWLGQHSFEHPRLLATLAVANPWDLKACCQHMESFAWGRFYRAAMVRCLQRRCLSFLRDFPDALNGEAVRSARTFHDFDSAVTAPLHGFADADTYYAESSSADYLQRVKSRLLCLDALDDPFRHPRALPRAAPSCVELVRTEHGGHLGYLGPRASFWLEDFICARAAAYLGS